MFGSGVDKKRIEELEQIIKNKDLELEKNQVNLKKRILELEELLFLFSDTIHDQERLKKFSSEELADMGTMARLFTRYCQNDIFSINYDDPYKKRKDEFINFLKDDVWTKLYGISFNELIKTNRIKNPTLDN